MLEDPAMMNFPSDVTSHDLMFVDGAPIEEIKKYIQNQKKN